MAPTEAPSFAHPPLNEVVLGVQFDAVPGYSQIYASEVWNLFKQDYPVLQVQPAIPPAFETFAFTSSAGGMTWQGNVFPQITIQGGAPHPRFWFISREGNDLIQFQVDRLLHNWREVDGAQSIYPHYDAVKLRFIEELTRIRSYMERFSSPALRVTQVELSYVNRIYGTSDSELPKAEEWLKFIRVGDRQPESYGGSFREVVRREGQPPARLHCEVSTGADPNGRRMIGLNMTYRGAPRSPTIEAAAEFLDNGHQVVLEAFLDLTTDQAQAKWGRGSQQ